MINNQMGNMNLEKEKDLFFRQSKHGEAQTFTDLEVDTTT